MSEISPPAKNSNLSHYKIIKLINQGGMGEIYLAHDERLQRTVAIKTLKTEKLSQNTLCDKSDKNSTENNVQQEIENALNEARLLAKLSHPNIVQIYDITQDEQQLSLVMEYLTGKSLYRYQHPRNVWNMSVQNVPLLPNHKFDAII